MLYLLHMGNHQDITYKGGQGPIVHLEADLETVVEWAKRNGRKWAFSLSNAGARYTQFRNDLADLGELDWPAIMNNDFRSPDVKEGKQAEFLLHDSFPWELVERIGVYSNATAQQAAGAMSPNRNLPVIEIKKEWYF
jgi:ssDNA thymidine ADP-ribosyltransferase, DarT